jgi:hypothetical protein
MAYRSVDQTANRNEADVLLINYRRSRHSLIAKHLDI